MSNDITKKSSSSQNPQIKSQYLPVFIHKKYIKKVRNQKKEYFFIVSFNNEKEAKEVYIPFAWLQQHKSGEGYVGKLKFDMELGGIVKVPTKINTKEFLFHFPAYKMPKKGAKW